MDETEPQETETETQEPTAFDKYKAEHPYRMWWECKKIAFTEFLAKWFNIHLDL